MKYLKKFETEADKDVWLNSENYVQPNVVLTGETIGYNVEIDYSAIPLCIEAIGDITISFSSSFSYSKDNTTWSGGSSGTQISAIAGERVFFIKSGQTPSLSRGSGSFTISNGTCNVCGNIMSMAYGLNFRDKTEITAAYQFLKLFNGASVVNANKLVLPATQLADYCYNSMFYGCTSLVTAPSLPATQLAGYCYNSMFYGCTSLVTAPSLPATKLVDYCYTSMFVSCTSLVNAPVLPATTLASSCYSTMFYGCTSLVTAPSLPATTLANSCYRSMFSGCTSLVTAPSLPATKLVDYCYNSMFYNCSNLNHVKAMFKTTPSWNYTEKWLSGVAATGTFVKNAAATWDVTGVNGIPEGWTVETAEA